MTNVHSADSELDVAGLKKELAALRADLALLRRETELLRNELLDNIASINQLEIITFRQRLAMLEAFGKYLEPTRTGRSRDSFKKEGYTFGIITDGRRPERLQRLVESIKQQEISPNRWEILIAGTIPESVVKQEFRIFPMEDMAAQGRLGAMRNVLAKEAQFNKFVSLDDDLLLHPQWAQAVDKVNDEFDLATGVIVNPDLTRYCDWVNNVDGYTFLRRYNEGLDACQYLTGGYGIYKDYVFVEHSWDGALGFYQGEDVQFSRSLFAAGFRLRLIPEAIVMHDDDEYTQKGYGVVRRRAYEALKEVESLQFRLEKLCPRTIT
ncbi:MAG: glycosyltransferase family 2 protein [Desulfomonile sp.]|nr:glycosyltransferase family 2 protein [Desulfomonile sp.]